MTDAARERLARQKTDCYVAIANTILFSVRLFVPALLLLALAGCDAALVEPPPTPPEAPPPPAERPTVTKTIRALHVFAVGEPTEDRPLVVAEADTVREMIWLNVYAEVEADTTCPDGADCRERWTNWPLVTQTTLALDRAVVVDGETVEAGTDLLDRFPEWQQASLLTPTEEPTPLFAVPLDTVRFAIPAGPVGVAMRWGLEDGGVLTDTTRFVFIP